MDAKVRNICEFRITNYEFSMKNGMFGTIFYINNKVTSDFSHFFFIFFANLFGSFKKSHYLCSVIVK